MDRPVGRSGTGAETRFGYDARGLLVRRVDPDGAVWVFEHDPAGRMTASIAPDGGRTVLEYGPTGDLVRTTDSLGRVIERVVDELGNVTGAILPDGARWGFSHDALSRLVGITDPAGHDWVREYDRVGNLTAVVDPTGVRTDTTTDRATGTATITDAFASTTYTFDEYGRPTKTQGGDGSAELTTYDPAGNPVELLDAEGGLTVLGRDVAGKVTSITSPTGAVTRYEYDACGRPWRTTDPTGATTVLAYDADQRVTARTLPTGEVETFTYDSCGRLILRRTPGKGTARYGYDACGRLTFSQDTWYGTRRFTYNTAGELTSTINGVGGRTRFEYDARGRLVRITDPLGGVTTRTYTPTDQVDSVTDPLGRVTTATYDPAGRQLSQTDPDGHTTTWTYDAAGQEKSTSVDGRLLASVDRDVLNRRVVITDHTGTAGAGNAAGGLVVEHELGFNRRGQLTSRTRGGQGLSWAYDADGNRTSFTDATGTTTTYTHDPAGRLTTVTNPLLGDAVFTHDPSGRLTRITVGNLVQEWTYRDGNLTEHTRTVSSNQGDVANADNANEGGGTDVTLIGRDDDGRIIALTSVGTVTRYGYDGAGQMITATTTPVRSVDASASDPAPDASSAAAREQLPAVTSEWEYDAGGRLIRESTPAGTRVFDYDAAGQLLAITGPNESRTEFIHDGLGRRTRLIAADGSWTEYAWGPTGHLKSTCERTPDGDVTSRHELWVDALGELAGIDGTRLWWDTAIPIPTLTNITPATITNGIADDGAGSGSGRGQVLSLPGGVTGFGDVWTAPGWRAARPTDETDPWAVLGTPAIPMPGGMTGAGTAGLGPGAGAGPVGGLPAGVSLTGHGGVDIAGLEWLGSRAYDPGTRGFLSTDPLAPVLGAGWDGNPYAYAGNNPLNTTDPTGLRPLTDADLTAYDGSAGGAITAAKDWVGDNWEYVAAGAAIVAGVALMCTGVGGPVGMALIGAASGALISGGASAIVQKRSSGTVKMNKVWEDAAVGAVGGALGGAAGGLLARGAGAARMATSAGSRSSLVTKANSVLGSSAVRSSLAAGVGGSGSNILSYRFDPNVNQTVGGYFSAAGTGFLTAAGGSAILGKFGTDLGDGMAARLPRLSASVGRHELRPRHVGPPVNWGSVMTEQLVNRGGGAAVGVMNTELQPGQADDQDRWNGLVQGFANGGTGLLSGTRAGGR